MSTTARRLRILFRGEVPLRVSERLLDGAIPWLDRDGQGLYDSVMNEVVRDQEAGTGRRVDTGATLFTFLDVADRLYERVGQALGSVGLSYPKYEVLKHLSDAGAPVSLGALADGQSCARSNITQLVDRLETEGLVRRVPDPDDRRGVRAELTEQGASAALEGQTQMDLVLAEFAASFSAPERAEFGRLLSKVR